MVLGGFLNKKEPLKNGGSFCESLIDRFAFANGANIKKQPS